MAARSRPRPHQADAPDVPSERAQFSRELAALHAKPLWERSIDMGPGNDVVPCIWRWRDLRPQLLRAAELISTAEAERRVLMLENPGIAGSTYTTTCINAGLQIIMPGEVAPAHRHSTNALRFIVEGSGAYSTVEGERVAMQPGDFVLTPYWTWHDHGHAGSEPVVWLDALDNPIAKMLGAMFREHSPHATHPVTRAANEAGLRWGEHLLPVGVNVPGLASPLMVYPYERTRATLLKLARLGPVDPVHGVKLRYANPANGGYPFPTMAVFIQWLPSGFAGAEYRATDGTIFCVVEGRGRIRFGAQVLDFEPRDIFVAPSWTQYTLDADDECILFSCSDRAAQEALGFWREQRPE